MRAHRSDKRHRGKLKALAAIVTLTCLFVGLQRVVYSACICPVKRAISSRISNKVNAIAQDRRLTTKPLVSRGEAGGDGL
ncbi:hypothetical protein EVAR_41744_1 [Eumeta japonica]|uniref:Uncharacterized protein n=1 Tax=Eumeta variegata TaxID=151549 RepID=A0A4C1VXY5_EUMVA|nr:hypothetical protein EVAR_41744_1 [Eumeta japonica]